MIYQLQVPAAVPGVDEIRILEWHITPGDVVEQGKLIVELETHKAVIEVRAAQSGVLRSILATEGDWKGVGLPLALFSSEANEALPDGEAELALMLAQFEVT